MSKFNFDMSSLPLLDFMVLINDPDLGDLLEIMNTITDEDLMEKTVADLPAMIAEFTREVERHSDDIAIAVASMRRFLDDDEED